MGVHGRRFEVQRRGNPGGPRGRGASPAEYGRRGGFGSAHRGARGGRGGAFGARAPYEPGQMISFGNIKHACEDTVVIRACHLDKQTVPYFSGRVFLGNNQEIGMIDEIFGPIDQMFVSIKLNKGFTAQSLSEGTSVYIDANQRLPLSRFVSSGLKACNAKSNSHIRNHRPKPQAGRPYRS